MDQPLVTVVTPSYNQGRFIRATIESVLSQEYPRIEYIVMDGGSADETASVIGGYATRLEFVSERDRGQSHAINKGFRRARGSIVAWLNSDDLFLPGAVTHAVAALAAHPESPAIYGRGYLIDEHGGVMRPFPSTQAFDRRELVHLSDYILQPTVFFRKTVFDQLGYLDEDLHYVMDWDILIRIAKRYDLEYVPEYLACLREYPAAKSFSGGKRRIQEIGRLMKRHTGSRWAPGYIVYGLEAYKPVWCEWIDSHLHPGLAAPIRRGVIAFANLCIAAAVARGRRRGATGT